MRGRVFSLAILIVLCSTMLFAGGQGETSSAEERMTIKWSGANPRGQLLQPDSMVELYLEEKFDVNLEPYYEWDVYQSQQINVNLASGEIPDVFGRGVPVGPYADSNYIRPLSREMIYNNMPRHMAEMESVLEENTLKFSSYDGEVWGVPYINLLGYAAAIFNYREDWSDDLGYELYNGMSLDELEEVLTAMVTDDPDGNGQDDTAAWGVHKNSNGIRGKYSQQDLFSPVFGAYRVRLNSWQEVDGTLRWGMLDPNYPEALKVLNRWYEKGIIDQAFVSDMRKQFVDKWANGKVFGWSAVNAWSGFRQDVGPHKALMENDPDVDIGWLVEVRGGPNNEAGVFGGHPYNGTMAIGFGVSDEKAEKVLQMWESMSKDEEVYAMTNYGIEGTHYNWVDGILVIPEGMGTAESLAETGRQYFSLWTNNDTTSVPYKLSAWRVDAYNLAASYIHLNVPFGYLGPPLTEELNAMDAGLQTMEEEFFFKSIVGAYDDIDEAFAEFVRRWKSSGGDEITAYQVANWKAGL